jgi:hypothetical protein
MKGGWLVFSWFRVLYTSMTVTLLKVPDEWLHMGTHLDTRKIYYQNENEKVLLW